MTRQMPEETSQKVWEFSGNAGLSKGKATGAEHRFVNAYRVRSNSETSPATRGFALSTISCLPKRASIRSMPLASVGPSSTRA